jgi:hypothetical protein
MRTETVKEYVLYRGAFDSEHKVPLFSDAELELVQHRRHTALHDALAAGYARPTFSIGCRTVVYPLSAAGKRQALGSTCEEAEVANAS